MIEEPKELNRDWSETQILSVIRDSYHEGARRRRSSPWLHNTSLLDRRPVVMPRPTRGERLATWWRGLFRKAA
ncbi:MAG: hypothetical protein R3F11_04135 [Verrucomicrobiales bacterium]